MKVAEEVRRLRMKLARRVAPAPIMVDPFRGDGVFIYYRGKDQAYRFEWVLKAERFRMHSSHRLPSLDFEEDVPMYRPPQTLTRFVGTAGR